MCLSKISLSLPDPQQRIFFKCFELQGSAFFSPYRDCLLVLDTNVKQSSRNSTNLTNKEVEWDEVHHGFHVYVTRSAAEKQARHHDNNLVVEVECDPKDFVACGKFQFYAGLGEAAVFTRYTLPQREVDRLKKLLS